MLLNRIILRRDFPLNGKLPVVPQAQVDEPVDLVSQVQEIFVETQKLIELTLKRYTDDKEEAELVKLIRIVIGVLDSFERLLGLARQFPPSTEVDNWLKSMESIYYRLFNSVNKLGLEEIPALGERVNFDYHEVVEYLPSEDFPHNSVISVRQKGYWFRRKIIRDAKVVVGYHPKSEVEK